MPTRMAPDTMMSSTTGITAIITPNIPKASTLTTTVTEKMNTSSAILTNMQKAIMICITAVVREKIMSLMTDAVQSITTARQLHQNRQTQQTQTITMATTFMDIEGVAKAKHTLHMLAVVQNTIMVKIWNRLR